MEKYQRFTDPATQVNPFVTPPWRPSLARSLLGALLAAPRLALLLAAALPLLLLVDAAAARLPRSLARGLRLALGRPLARAALFLLGFHHIDRLEPQRSLFQAPAAAPAAPAAPAGGGLLVVGNTSGLVDVLAWTALVAPVFTRLSADGTRLDEATLLDALLDRVRSSVPAPGSAPAPASASTPASPPSSASAPAPASASARLQALLLDAAAGPVLVLPEAAPSNNRAVLAFAQGALSALENALTPAVAQRVRVQVAALRFPAAGAAPSPCFVAGSALRHVAALAMQPSNALQLLWLPEGSSPQPAAFAGAGAAWAAATHDALCRALRVKAVRLDRAAHADYVREVAR